MVHPPVFLSYTHVDDIVPAVHPDRPGWVRFFHDYVSTELLTRFSRQVHFWRDANDVPPHGDFAARIAAALEEAAVLVAVVSGNYIDRKWCLKELEDFVALRAAAGRLDPEQVFKILKHPVPEEKLPLQLRGLGRGFKFFEVEPYTGVERQFFMAGQLRPEYDQRYKRLIEEIAHHIMGHLGAAVAQAPAAPLAAARTVFVAVPPVSSSVREVYLSLVSELRQGGLAVRPDPEQPFPDTLAAADAMLDQALAPVELVIHLIGENGGKILEDANEPMVHMQLRRSAQQMTVRPGLRRLIWLPKEVTSAQEQHATFLRGLRDFDVSQVPLVPVRDDLVSETFDAFLAQLRALLFGAAAHVAPLGSARGLGTAYVVAADEDVAEARRGLRTSLRDTARMVINVPLATDRPAQAREAHEAQRLRDADIAIVLWGGRDVDWVERQLDRVRRFDRLGRTEAFRSVVLLIVEPNSAEKEEEDPLGPGELRIDARAGLQAAATQLAKVLAPDPS